MDHPDSNIDRLLNAQANVDDRLQQYNTAVTTILFTDIVSPTAYSAILHRHTDLVSKTVAEFQGSIIKIMAKVSWPSFRSPPLQFKRRFRSSGTCACSTSRSTCVNVRKCASGSMSAPYAIR